MRRILTSATVVMICLISGNIHAKLSQPVWNAIQSTYEPAAWNEGLDTAYVNPDPSKFRGYVVVLKGGMAAEQARRFITWAEYDYRGVTIDLEKDTLKNRRGKVYTYLQPGDVMAVAKVDKLLDTVYVGLISPEVYRPANRSKDKHFSRVTTLLTFKLPKQMAEEPDPDTALAAMGAWVKPFSDLQGAMAYAQTVGTPDTQTFSAPTYIARPTVESKKYNPNPGMPPQLRFTDPGDTNY